MKIIKFAKREEITENLTSNVVWGEACVTYGRLLILMSDA